MQSVWQIKQEICEIGKRIWQKGFCAGNEGNHSVRIAPDRYLCTPTGISKGFLDPEDIITCDGEGNQVEPNSRGRRPTSEIKVHLAIYKVRNDVNAVIHSHPPHATAFAIAGIPLPEGVHPEAEVFLGKVKTAKYATPSTHDLPNSLLPLIGPETNTLLMGNHGSVSFDKDLIGAYYKLEILDAYCRILLLTKSIGKMNVLDKNQMTELLKVKEKFGFPDSRLACSPSGCVGQENNAFLAMFEQTASAQCSCESGKVEGTQDALGAAAFEDMVQAITDKIMSAVA
ncbi:MAG: class II aldolase/adducin family protein [Phycisphaera sp.]|nr:class II aldolase/adducin family protein [Phycisphaera sp.]